MPSSNDASLALSSMTPVGIFLFSFHWLSQQHANIKKAVSYRNQGHNFLLFNSLLSHAETGFSLWKCSLPLSSVYTTAITLTQAARIHSEESIFMNIC